MSKANSVGIGLGFVVAIYAVMVGLAGAPVWGLVVIAIIDGYYWAFGRRLIFPDEFDTKTTSARSREDRRQRRASR